MPKSREKPMNLRPFVLQARRNVYYRKRPPAASRRPVSRRSAFQALSRRGFAQVRDPKASAAHASSGPAAQNYAADGSAREIASAYKR